MFRVAMSCGVLALCGVAGAATWTVDDDGLADFDNIQAAIDAASDGDEIVVEPGTYTGTGNQVVDMLGKALTLRASGLAEDTVIDGENERTGVHCASQETSGTTIDGFTITGGGVLCADSAPVITRCRIIGNTYGGVRCYLASPEVSYCTISGNSPSTGGGIYCNNSSPTITGCEISDNTVSDDGGGISCDNNSSPTITDCTISGNAVFDGGGGIYCNSSNPTIADCTISNNSADDNGGGIYCFDNSNPTITDCTITNNTASDAGAGIRLNLGCTAVISGCTITDNTSSAYSGGGVYSDSYLWGGSLEFGAGQAIISDSIICGNTPNQISGPWVDEGGVCSAPSCNDADGDGFPDECATIGDGVHEVPGEYETIQDAVDAAGQGDVVLVGPGTWHGTGYEVLDLRGKAIVVQSTDGPEVTTIDGEGARRGIAFHSGELSSTMIDGFTVQNCVVNDEPLGSSFWRQGGGILCYGASPKIMNCIIKSNRSEYPGGGISLVCSEAVIDHCVISNNISRLTGGIIVLDGAVQITDTQIQGNVSEQGLGGGLYLWGHTPGGGSTGLVLTESTISENVSTGGNGGYFTGGGILIYQGTVIAQNCSIANNINEHGNGGGGITVSGSYVELSGCEVSSNVGSGGIRGGGIYDDTGLSGASASEVVVEGCDFIDNNSGSSSWGSAIYLYDWSQGHIATTTVCGSGPTPLAGPWLDGGGNYIDDECPDCPDINGDGLVGVDEILAVIAAWGTDEADADVNDDGIVDTDDLLLILSAWGPCE